MGLDSRQATEDEKRELRSEEEQIIDDIISKSETLRPKVIRWAEVLEKRIELLDVDFEISQISTYITRVMIERHCPGVSHVRSYLPDKYKNQNMMRVQHVANQLETAFCDPLDRKPLEQFSMMEMEFELEYLEKTDNDTDKLLMLLNNRKEDIYREAIRRGYDSIAGKKIRDQISARDYRWEIPKDLTLEEANKEVQIQGLRYEKEIHRFYQVNYPEFPATQVEDALKYANTTRVLANIWAIINEKKWSGDVDFWLGRDYFLRVQSAHKSGNSTMFPTTLCAFCSRNVEDDPKDFHVSKYDKNSPTGYKCDNCGGYEIRYRNNSREQVGDKHEENQRMAEDIINHIPYYPDLPMDWRKRYMNPPIYSRKLAISKEFSIAAFGKEKQVIARKKATK